MKKPTELCEEGRANLELRIWKMKADGSSSWKLEQYNSGVMFGHCPLLAKRLKVVIVRVREFYKSERREAPSSHTYLGLLDDVPLPSSRLPSHENPFSLHSLLFCQLTGPLASAGVNGSLLLGMNKRLLQSLTSRNF